MPDQVDDAEPSEYPIAAYVAALVAYVGLGVFLRTILLNWIVGPTFLLLALYLLPRALRPSKRG